VARILRSCCEKKKSIALDRNNVGHQNTFGQVHAIDTQCSLCRLIRLLSTWCRAAAFFSASGATLSQEVPTVKWMSNQPALWTPDIWQCKSADLRSNVHILCRQVEIQTRVTDSMTRGNSSMLCYMSWSQLSVAAFRITVYPRERCRSQWPRGLKHELSSFARTLGSWVRITLEAWMSLCVYSAFVSGSGLATGWSLV
jgi:hypothetical protein